VRPFYCRNRPAARGRFGGSRPAKIAPAITLGTPKEHNAIDTTGGCTFSREPNSPLYTFTFGLIDYPRSQMGLANGINDHGQIVGGYNNTNLEIYTADHGLKLKGDSYSTIDYPGATQTELIGINKHGQVVGAFSDSSGNIHGFTLASGTFTQLDYPGASETVALGINGSGTIVGIYVIGSMLNGYVLTGGTYTSIAVPGALYTYLSGINNHGVIAGYTVDASMNIHGFTWDSGTITTIDYGNGYPNTYLAGITDSGVIVGGYGSWITINSIEYPCEHGFLYSGGIFSTFDVPFGDVQVTQPFGINNNDEIVGGYVDGQGMLYGFYLKAQ
jgi:probable HAF family extracellular repeat protein